MFGSGSAPIRMTKWRTLALATLGFNFSFLIWFSFAPFSGVVAEEFGLSSFEVGVLASSAIWLIPIGRVVVGWLSDRFGATAVFSILLATVGLFSILSAFSASYLTFFLTRLVVASAGVSFVIGIQHVSEWFPDEQLGTAEGIYAGIGNAGAGVGALVLPRAFGADWRTAFLLTGIVSVVFAVVYFVFGVDARTEAQRQATRSRATLREWVWVATRYGVIVLTLGYMISFGLEIAMNGWLPTYAETVFGAEQVAAATIAAAFSLTAGLTRPFGGYISDRLVRNRRDILPGFGGRYREQWTIVSMGLIVVGLVGLGIAGAFGSLAVVAVAVVFVGFACAMAEAAIFAQVPETFPNRTGMAAGVIGGVSTVGGAIYPLVFGYTTELGVSSLGYLAVAGSMVPVVLLAAWAFRPARVESVNREGLVNLGD